MIFVESNNYTKQEIWTISSLGSTDVVNDNWNSNYTSNNGYLYIFCNVTTMNNIYPCKIHKDGTLEWYGKPSAHSAQRDIKKLLDGDLIPLIFIQHNNLSTSYTFWGSPRISSFYDNVPVTIEYEGKYKKINTININFLPEANHSFDDNNYVQSAEYIGIEGGTLSLSINAYERDPKLRTECIKHHGTNCAVCNFSFERLYGELGSGFCHIHHIEPLGEVKHERSVNPKTDLIPLCANCHSMIHRVKPALSINELKVLLKPIY